MNQFVVMFLLGLVAGHLLAHADEAWQQYRNAVSKPWRIARPHIVLLGSLAVMGATLLIAKEVQTSVKRDTTRKPQG